MWGKPDIDDKICFMHMEDFRPTLKRKFIRGIYDSKKYHDLKISDYLAKTEDDAREFVGLSEEEFAKIVDYFKRYNLHFGMTEEEFDAYRDADYFEKHPEEAPDYVKPDATEEPETEEVEEVDKEVYAAAVENERKNYIRLRLWRAHVEDSLEEKPLPTWDTDKFERKFDALLSSTRDRDITANDIEWQRARMMEIAFSNLPWYYKLLPIECQIKKATQIFDALFEAYQNGLYQRMRAYDRQCYHADVERVKEENSKKAYRKERLNEQFSREFDEQLKDGKIKITIPKEPKWDDPVENTIADLLLSPKKCNRPVIRPLVLSDEI